MKRNCLLLFFVSLLVPSVLYSMQPSCSMESTWQKGMKPESERQRRQFLTNRRLQATINIQEFEAQILIYESTNIDGLPDEQQVVVNFPIKGGLGRGIVKAVREVKNTLRNLRKNKEKIEKEVAALDDELSMLIDPEADDQSYKVVVPAIHHLKDKIAPRKSGLTGFFSWLKEMFWPHCKSFPYVLKKAKIEKDDLDQQLPERLVKDEESLVRLHNKESKYFAYICKRSRRKSETVAVLGLGAAIAAAYWHSTLGSMRTIETAAKGTAFALGGLLAAYLTLSKLHTRWHYYCPLRKLENQYTNKMQKGGLITEEMANTACNGYIEKVGSDKVARDTVAQRFARLIPSAG